jgi:hypothetical protein
MAIDRTTSFPTVRLFVSLVIEENMHIDYPRLWLYHGYKDMQDDLGGKLIYNEGD